MLTLGSFLQAHDPAAFLAWHRYFIHIHETTLKHHCGYTGSVAYVMVMHIRRLQKTDTWHDFRYWDWDLDWEDIRNSLPFGIAEPGSVGTGIPAKANQFFTDTASKMVLFVSSKSSIWAKSITLIVCLVVSKAVEILRISAQNWRPRLWTVYRDLRTTRHSI